MAFTDKVKVIRCHVPEKVNLYIEKNLEEELKYFQKKYAFKIEIISNENFIIPEYQIDLLNKSKKLLNKVENINNIVQLKKVVIEKKKKNKKLIKKEPLKLKSKKKLRTLWVRRKKKVKSIQK